MCCSLVRTFQPITAPFNVFLSETGISTKRYARGGKFIHRDFEKEGPALDENGKYRPQRPTVSHSS